MTLGRYNTMEDVDAVVEALAEVVPELRNISPLGKETGKEEKK
jgi:cysteine desulfurase